MRGSASVRASAGSYDNKAAQKEVENEQFTSSKAWYRGSKP